MSGIAVIGAGYVGLTAATCLAHLGHTVICADIDEKKVDALNKGEVPIHETRLPELLRDGLSQETLKFVVGARQAVTDSEFVFLCLPTPQGDDGRADISVISQVIEEIRDIIPAGSTIVNKSTTPVGTNAAIQSLVRRDDVAVVSNPEFLREGVAVTDFLQPDRIVIGSTDPEAAQKVSGLYGAVDAPIITVDPLSAETIKYATNSFLATKVSFVNALAAVCEAVGADIESVTRGLGADQRIGSRFLQPGPGWGGSCFPKDMQALVRMADDAGYQFDLLRAVIEANEQQFARIVSKVERLVGDKLAGAKISLLGLTFKAHTDDLRNSPALEVAKLLSSEGARVIAYDPMVESNSGLPTEIELAQNIERALTGSDAVVILTEWPEFTRANWGALREFMNAPRVLDARNALDRRAMLDLGFQYDDLGRI